MTFPRDTAGGLLLEVGAEDDCDGVCGRREFHLFGDPEDLPNPGSRIREVRIVVVDRGGGRLGLVVVRGTQVGEAVCLEAVRGAARDSRHARAVVDRDRGIEVDLKFWLGLCGGLGGGALAFRALAFGALAFVPTWLHERGGLPLWMAGATVAAFGLGGFLYTINAARLVRRLGESGLALAGGGVLALGFALLAATPGALSGAIACAMIGLGYHMLHNTLQTNATQMAPAVRGTAVALFAMSLFIGQSLGVGVAAQAVGAGSFVAVFAVAALGLFALGAAFARRLRNRGLRAA